MPAPDERRLDGRDVDWPAHDVGDLRVGVDEGRGERRHVDGVADGLVARRVDDVPERKVFHHLKGKRKIQTKSRNSQDAFLR